jgi:hypothetical protein
MLERDNRRPAEYQVIHAGWMAEFEPEGYQEERLVEILIHNDWTLKLAERRLMQAEEALLDGWTPERQTHFDALLRSKSAAQRLFYQAWRVLRGMQKDLERRQVQVIRLQAKIDKVQMEIAERKKALGLTGEDEPTSTGPQSLHSLHTFCAPNMQPGTCSNHEVRNRVRALPRSMAGVCKDRV